MIGSGGHTILEAWRHHFPSNTLKHKGHFTHEPRAVTMKLWEPNRKCPKAVPTHLHNHVVLSRALKCSVKPFVTGRSTKCYFNEFLFIRSLRMIKENKPTVVSVRSVMVLRFCIGLPPRSSKWVWNNNPSEHETWFIRCHVGIHVDFTSILHSHTPLVPQA